MRELALIKSILPLLDEHELDKFDDAVALRLGDHYVVVNVDSITWESDAPPGMTYEQFGRKIVVATLSDVVAKGAKPVAFMASGLFPRGVSEDEVLRIVRGIRSGCDEYGVKYVGGDLGESRSITLVGTCIGVSRRVVRRSGARPGDLVWVTGEFGLTGAGFHFLLVGGKRTRGIDAIVRSVLEPCVRLREGLCAGEIATASMDSSDGLAVTLNDLATASGVKIVLDELPIAREALEYAVENGVDPEALALYAGEEFEIVFTTRGMSEEDVREFFRSHGAREPILIGRCKEGSGVFLRGRRIPRRGWEHFSREWLSSLAGKHQKL